MSRSTASGSLQQPALDTYDSSQAASTAAANSRTQPKEEAKERVRLSFEVSPQVNSLLEELANGLGITKSEAFRRAVVLMKVAADAYSQGKKLGIAEKDQRLSTEIVGLFGP